MALITFLSDFGRTDHYVAAVKAGMLSLNPDQQIVDLSHDIDPCNLAQASFVLNNVFRDFPEGSVHLMGVDSSNKPDQIYLALKIEEHYFVGVDNGFWGLISEENASIVVNINGDNQKSGLFAARDILAPAAVKLATGTAIEDLGESVESYHRMLPRRAKATRKQISGHVIHVDHFGNLITNIQHSDFEILSKGKKYEVKFGRELLMKVHDGYGSVESGDCFLVFNTLGLLEIGINNGNASELLGLDFDSPVQINFEE